MCEARLCAANVVPSLNQTLTVPLTVDPSILRNNWQSMVAAFRITVSAEPQLKTRQPTISDSDCTEDEETETAATPILNRFQTPSQFGSVHDRYIHGTLLLNMYNTSDPMIPYRETAR